MSPVKYYLVGPLVFISRFRSARSLMTVRYGSSVFGPTTSLLPTRTLDGTTRAPTASVHVPFDRVRAMPLGHRHPPLLLPFASNIFFLFPSFHFALKCNRTNIFRYRKIECPLTNSNRVNRFSSSLFFFFFLFFTHFFLFSSFSFQLLPSRHSLFRNHLHLFEIDPTRSILISFHAIDRNTLLYILELLQGTLFES